MSEKIFSLISGIIFGTGLVISGMTNPEKVIGFLSITHNWDASLIFVMGGAIIVTAPFFYLLRNKNKSLLGLDIKPDHKGINEYLGELYVATGRLDLAKERLKILENCNCEEYQELKEVIEGTKKSKY